jgi:L-asparaginase II
MNPVLVEIYRDKVLESFHRGVVCVVDQGGEILYSEGDVNQVCYPRSAMKLLQVLPLIENGGMEKFNFTLEEIAVMCGSHNAEPEHLRAVSSILQKIGLDKSALQCGPQYPTSRKDSDELIRKGEKPHDIHNNCSGKHAGMLAMCVLKGWQTKDYINPKHPLQQLILNLCAEFYEYPKEKMTTALDGCSAPIFSVPVYNQAVGYKNLTHPKKLSSKIQEACATVIEAVSKHPFMVAGTKRYCTDMMRITAPRIIGKTGAESIFCMAMPRDKIGVCIKIDDGKMLPQYNVAQAFVEATGIFSRQELEPLHHYSEEPILNSNQYVSGRIKVREGLFANLKLRKKVLV